MRPPSTRYTWPVIQSAAAEAGNSISVAMPLGPPVGPGGGVDPKGGQRGCLGPAQQAKRSPGGPDSTADGAILRVGAMPVGRVALAAPNADGHSSLRVTFNTKPRNAASITTHEKAQRAADVVSLDPACARRLVSWF